MGNRIRLHYIWIIFCVMALSCTRNDEPTEDIGYLTMGVIQVDKTMIDVVDSRVGADNDFYLVISKDGEPLTDGTFGPKDVFPQKLSLIPGEYTYELYNEAYNEYQNWTNDNLGKPVYYFQGSFSITPGITVSLDATVQMCVLGVKLVLPQGQTVATAHSLKVVVGNRNVSITDGQTAYFPLTELAQLKYQFSMTNMDDEAFEGPQQVYSGKLEANTIYEINVDLSGTVSLSSY